MPEFDTEIFPAFADYLQPARFKVAYGGRGSAKCLGRGTMLLRADASLVAVEDVKVGDLLLGPDGKPRTVLSTANGVSPLYKITQKTGMSYVVNDAHILVLERSESSKKDYGTFSKAGLPQRKNGRYHQYDSGKGYSLITAKEYASKPERFKTQHYGFRRAVIGEHKELPIDPYLLGLWLGDGSKTAPEITSCDFEVVDYINKISKQNNWVVNSYDHHKAPRYYLGNKYQRDGSFFRQLRDSNLLENKHIPEEYFGASLEQRRSLLAGLIDTDGTIDCGYIAISQSVERIIDDIIRLAHGLGLKASKKEIHPVCCNNGKICHAWTAGIGGDIDNLPLLIKRKKEAASNLRKNKDWRRSRVDIEPIGDGEYFGFELDGDHLFMLADGTVTHNTRSFASIITNNVLFFGWRVVCLRETMESISESVYQEFVEEIERRELGAYFTVLKTHIECPQSGGVVKFAGLRANAKRLDSQKLKGFSNFDAAWLEEANAVSKESWQALIPTMRKNGSEIWVSYNPGSTLEETHKLFVTNRYFPDFDEAGNRYCIVKKINHTDNPRFPKELRDHMEVLREVDFEAYQHIYEGEPIGNDSLAVIKSAWVNAAVDAHLKLGLEATGPVQGGFDVADDGPDRNALVWKKGFITFGAEEWNDKDPNSAASHAHSRCLELAIETLRYDDIGVGAGAKGQFRQLQEQTAEAVGKKYHRVHTDGWTASAAVDNPDREYMPGKKNKDMFLNKKAQAWWTLADKFRNTFNAVNGKPYDPEKLVSISSGIQHLEKLKAELSQPNRDYVNGKVKVESKADMKKRGVASPNLADAFVMAHDDGGGFDINSLL